MKYDMSGPDGKGYSFPGFALPKYARATICAMCFFAIILRGVVISQLWNWFVVPLGAGEMGIGAGIGLDIFIHFLLKKHNFWEFVEIRAKAQTLKDIFESMLYSMFAYPLAVFCACSVFAPRMY